MFVRVIPFLRIWHIPQPINPIRTSGIMQPLLHWSQSALVRLRNYANYLSVPSGSVLCKKAVPTYFKPHQIPLGKLTARKLAVLILAWRAICGSNEFFAFRRAAAAANIAVNTCRCGKWGRRASDDHHAPTTPNANNFLEMPTRLDGAVRCCALWARIKIPVQFFL